MNQRKTILRLVTSVRFVLETKCYIFITELDTISISAQECFRSLQVLPFLNVKITSST